MKEKQFCFVPTVSALALSNWEDKLNQDLQLSTTNYFLTGKTGFELIDAYSGNELHTDFYSSAAFLFDQLAPPLSHISWSPLYTLHTISGTLYLRPGELLEVNSGGIVLNANIVAYPGSKIVLKNGGIIRLRSNGTLDIRSGAIIDFQYGDVEITP